MSAGEIVAKLGSALTAQQSQLRTARSQRMEQQASRTLREEQDSAYERSLAQDRERARIRREEQEAREQAERRAQEAEKAAEELRQKSEQWRNWRSQSLPPEPGPEVKDAVRVSIRMPSGQRVIRKFHFDATLEELYSFIDCHGIVEESPSTQQTGTHKPDDYEHTFGFRIVSPMPRTVYALEDGGTIGGRIGKGANLIVEPIIVDDEE